MTCIWLRSPGPESKQALWATWKPVLVQKREGGEEWHNEEIPELSSLSDSSAHCWVLCLHLWEMLLSHSGTWDSFTRESRSSSRSWREQTLLVLVTALTFLPPAFLKVLKKCFTFSVLPRKFCRDTSSLSSCLWPEFMFMTNIWEGFKSAWIN